MLIFTVTLKVDSVEVVCDQRKVYTISNENVTVILHVKIMPVVRHRQNFNYTTLTSSIIKISS